MGLNSMIVQGDEVKVTYCDGLISNGVIRAIRGKYVSEDENSVKIKRNDREIVIGKSFLVKLEKFHNNRRDFDY